MLFGQMGHNDDAVAYSRDTVVHETNLLTYASDAFYPAHAQGLGCGYGIEKRRRQKCMFALTEDGLALTEEDACVDRRGGLCRRL